MSLRNRHLALFLCVCAAWLGTVAHAQVVRCTDTRTGKVTYTDGACTGGAAAREVEARKTPEELQLEREQAAEALERKQQRLQAEATAAETEARRNAERDRARAAQAAAAAPQPQDYAEVEKARATQPRVVVVPPSRHRPLYPDPFPQAGTPQPPPRLTQCGDFRCTDNLGNTYPRTGPGRFPGPGGVCRSNGGQAPC